MKKLLLLTALSVGTAISASAQISKGATFLGGNVGFNTNTTKPNTGAETKQTSLSISPSVGFAYKENRVWGVMAAYYYNKTKSDFNQDNQTYALGVFLRQYKPLGKGFYLFAEEAASGSYTKGKTEYTNSIDSKGFNINLGISPGFAYDVSKKFQLELTLNNLLYASYGHSKVENTYPASPANNSVTKSNNFTIGSNLSNLANVNYLTVGARFVFGRS
jgi:hypothetical protein